MKTHKIALLGFGTVGGGVGEILYTQSAQLECNLQKRIEVTKIVVRSKNKTHMRGLDESLFTEKFSDIIRDKNIETVVEVIGGITVAKEMIEQALQHKKNVVTANKALIAEYGNELFPLAKKYGVSLLFEASVGGAIPIINILNTQYTPGGITKISGIINGTCNYMLTELEKGGVEYPDILAKAQRKGFAESDPTADVEGIDATQKVAILASLGFQIPIPQWKDIPRKGISDLTAKDFFEAKKAAKRIRLVACAEKKGNEVFLEVSPQLLDTNSKLGNIMGVENAVIIENTFSNEICITGQGAGSHATAMAVISDIATLAMEE